MRIAAFTMVYNEPFFLRLWAAHYGRQIGAENLFCLDHGSTDGSVAGVVANTIRLPRGEFAEVPRANCVSHFQASLLSYYDAVIFSDADEFLVADPARYDGLADFLARRLRRTVRAVGCDVVHVTGEEPALDPARPVLAQRGFARFSPRYCKPLASRVPITWRPGFHSCDQPAEFDTDLYLFHLKFADSALFHDLQAKRREVTWSEEAIASNHGGQWRMEAEELAARAFPAAAPADAPMLGEAAFHALLQDPEASRDQRRLRAPFRIPERFREAIPGLAGEAIPAAAPPPARPALAPAEAAPPGGARPAARGAEQVAEIAHEGRVARFLIANPRDYIQRQHATGSFYEFRQLLVHQDMIPRGSVVLDVGANVGNHTIFYAHHTGATRILPFEPNPEAQAVLRRNVELNAASARVPVDLQFVHYAVGAAPSRLRIAAAPPGNLGATQFAEAAAGEGTVESMPLDSLAIPGRVGFLKVDVEGMEMQVLAGARRLVERFRPVIFVEVNRANEAAFWAWMDEARYVAVGATYAYLPVKNFLIVPRA